MAPMPWQKAFQTPEVNWGPRSETMFWGIPCNRTTCLTSRSAVSAAEGSLGRATKCTILENPSTKVRMVLLPREVGSPVTKSRATSDQGRPGMGKGREETRRGTMGRLAAGACVARRNELQSVRVQGGPPKPPSDELGRTGGPGVAG